MDKIAPVGAADAAHDGVSFVTSHYPSTISALHVGSAVSTFLPPPSVEVHDGPPRYKVLTTAYTVSGRPPE